MELGDPTKTACSFLTDETRLRKIPGQPDTLRQVLQWEMCPLNCDPWLSARLKCGRSPAGWLWRRFALASWLSVCVLCTCVHVWPCVVCLQQYAFTIVLLPLRQTTPERRVCLLISFFFLNIMLQGTGLHALFPPLSFVFFEFLNSPLDIRNVFVSQFKTNRPKIHFKIVFTWLHSSIIRAAVKCLLSSQSIHSQWQHTASLWTQKGPLKQQLIRSMGSVIPI